MPYSFYEKLESLKLKPTRMATHMADSSITYRRGIVEDLLVSVGEYTFSVDFFVLDMKEEEGWPMILRKPFLSIAHYLVDIHNSKHTLSVREEKITFGVKKISINIESNKDVFFIEEIDEMGQFDELKKLEKIMEDELLSRCNARFPKKVGQDLRNQNIFLGENPPPLRGAWMPTTWREV